MGGEHLEKLREALAAHGEDRPPKFPCTGRVTPEAIAYRWARLEPSAKGVLLDPVAEDAAGSVAQNIENYIGQTRVPLGVAGPLRVNGLHARGDFFVPLATTEAALVASYHRGCSVLMDAGGCSAMLLAESVCRSPAFLFASLAEAGAFVAWLVTEFEAIRERAESTTNHGKLQDITFHLEGNTVYLKLEFFTADAAGQNMVTLATQAACDWISAKSPVTPRTWYVEANMSGDKKSSAMSLQGVRGKKVSAEATLNPDLLKRRLRVTAREMEQYWRTSALGGVMSGTTGVQGHYANGLAALFLATGQDVASISEAAVGVTRFNVNDDGSLHVTVTLPNLIVGTVGGGAGLATQQACLDLMGLGGAGKARAFAEVCCALALAGEISIIAAITAGEFARAHQKRARGKGSNT